MSDKIVFFNIGWMDFYKGLSNDKIKGGGKHIDKVGWGYELFNFKPFQNHLYGYVQPKIDKKYGNPSTINIEKLGALKRDQSIKNITVIWTARDPIHGGTYIIGWYINATIFRYYQNPPRNSKRDYKHENVGYYAMAKAKDAVLLPIDERNVRVQRQKKNWMGQSNVWFADNNPAFVKLVMNYIQKGVVPRPFKSDKKSIKGTPKQLDPLRRIEVEKKAILVVTNYYKKLGFKVTSVERDNLGWDLTAINNKTKLKIEVKGLSGLDISTELTPNEFKNLRADKFFYRLCIVTNTLKKPLLKIFTFSRENNKWTSEDGTIIKFEKVVGARIYE